MDVELLSRVQFAFTASFHYIYPPMSIGLGLLLVVMEGMYLRTKNPVYERLTKFWVKVFALIFAVGVASGIVLEFEFGTNWATYSRYVGDIFGSALAAEGIFAFFLESGFLAILVFGWDRVKPAMHFFSTCMVALGSTFSAVWIIVANSWQQTPAGFVIEGEGLAARARITDFWAMVFNPSSVDRLTHTVVAAWATGGFLVISVSAYYLLKRQHVEVAQAAMKIAVPFTLAVTLIQPILGHKSAVGVAKNQPAKMAAFEGHHDSSKPMDLVLLGFYDEESASVKGLSVPGGASMLLKGDAKAPVVGLNDFAKEDRPPIQATFQFYHAMVLLGMAMIAMALAAGIQLWRGRLETSTLLLKLLVPSILLPHLANQAGWFAAEVGRQPWIVYGLLRTSDGLSKVVKANQVLGSLVLFGFLYVLLFVLFVYLLDRKIKAGPDGDIADSISLAHGVQQ